MSDRFEDRAAVLAKIYNEGGIWEALEYGLRADDMPEGDDELITAWRALRNAFTVASAAWDKVNDLLPDEDER